MLVRPVIRALVRPPLRNIGRLRAGGSGVDADAAAWASAVTANGGTYSAATLAAMSTFVKSAKASGYWSKLNRINLFCGDQLAAALVPLKVGGGSATDTNVNFVSGDYSEATGLTGNGTTKYLNTGLLASALSANDTHLSVYNRSSTATTGGTHIGASASGASRLLLQAPLNDGVAYSDQYDSTVGGGRANTAAAIGAPFGFIVGTRTASSAHTIYRNGSSAASNATSGGALPALSVYVFALNGAGTPTSYMAHPLAAYSIGSGLTGADATAYNTHMQAFQSSLGRAV